VAFFGGLFKNQLFWYIKTAVNNGGTKGESSKSIGNLGGARGTTECTLESCASKTSKK